jgi:hypothetical protein
MKTMRCKDLGGTCNEKLLGRNVGWHGEGHDETRHGEAPYVAKAIEAMHKEDSKKWGREMKPKWKAAPQT